MKLRPEPRLVTSTPRLAREFHRRFGTESRCLEHLFRVRFPEGRECSECKGITFRFADHTAHCARGCEFQIDLIHGTIFDRTKHMIRRWFKAAFYLMVEPHVTAKRLAQLLNVTYKTGWTWARKLRGFFGTLLVESLRAVERTCWNRSLLQAADYEDETTCTPEQWNALVDAYGARPKEPAAAPRARRFLFQAAAGHISDKHLPAYLDHFVYRSLFETPFAAFLQVVERLPSSRRCTYRMLTGRPDRRPLLALTRAC